VVAVLPDGLRVRGPSGREAKITRRQRAAFDVGRAQSLAVSVGDRLLIRGREDNAGFTNGDCKEVAHVDPAADRIVFTDGRVLPRSFAAWTYGHALTSYRSQGCTSEESLLVLGEVATRALARRQFYVGNTRYRGAHAIYLSNKEEILRRLALPDPGRELATEFMQRHGLEYSHDQEARVRQSFAARARYAWQQTIARLRRSHSVAGSRISNAG